MKKILLLVSVITIIIASYTSAAAQVRVKQYCDNNCTYASQMILKGNWEIFTTNDSVIIFDEKRTIIKVLTGNSVFAADLAMDKHGDLHIIDNSRNEMAALGITFLDEYNVSAYLAPSYMDSYAENNSTGLSLMK